MENPFKWLGTLIFGSAKEVTQTVISDEVHKVSDQIAAQFAPLIAHLPQDQQDKLLPDLTKIGEHAAIAAIEAYINAQTPGAEPAVAAAVGAVAEVGKEAQAGTDGALPPPNEPPK